MWPLLLAQAKKIVSNFYIMTSSGLLIWMLFFDQNDFFTQVEMKGRQKAFEDEKEYFIQKIEEVKEDRKELLEKHELLEKYAREKYLMKKPTEQLFIVSETDETPVDEETPQDEENQ